MLTTTAIASPATPRSSCAARTGAERERGGQHDQRDHRDVVAGDRDRQQRQRADRRRAARPRTGTFGQPMTFSASTIDQHGDDGERDPRVGERAVAEQRAGQPEDGHRRAVGRVVVRVRRAGRAGSGPGRACRCRAAAARTARSPTPRAATGNDHGQSPHTKPGLRRKTSTSSGTTPASSTGDRRRASSATGASSRRSREVSCATTRAPARAGSRRSRSCPRRGSRRTRRRRALPAANSRLTP